ncbi:Gdt1 family - like 1 [Theobroma cacao]|nr:Gdt1 family - like 1 [Theobroma cacao]
MVVLSSSLLSGSFRNPSDLARVANSEASIGLRGGERESRKSTPKEEQANTLYFLREHRISLFSPLCNHELACARLFQISGDDRAIGDWRQDVLRCSVSAASLTLTVILAMRHPRRLVLSGCLASLVVMTILSAVVGWAAPNLISRKWTHHITTVLFLVFGLWSLWDGFREDGEAEELAEVEAKLDADWKANTGTVKEGNKADDELKKERRPFLTQFFSPIFLKAFSITFFGEWGDKSQLATIGLAAEENPFAVVLGGIVGQALCTIAAVLGGKSLASQISEKFVALSSGVLFIVFGIQSFLSTVES